MENIVRKGEIACNKQFLLFSQCVLPYMAITLHFNPFPLQALVFTCLQYQSLENTVGKGEIACNFSSSHFVFYHFGDVSAIFNDLKNVVCKLSPFGRV